MKNLKTFSSSFIFAVGFLVFKWANCSDVAEDFGQHKNIGLLKKTCGLPVHDRTLNSTDLFEFRWLALISFQGKRGLRFSCQGALISDRYVLTAAHCIANLPSVTAVSVRLGEHDFKSDNDCQTSADQAIRVWCADPPIDIGIEKIIIHPNYTNQQPRSAKHDIALLRLASPVVSSHFMPICLPVGEQTNILEKNLNLVGYSPKYKEDSIPIRMQVPVIEHERCAAALNNRVITSDEHNICIGGRAERNNFCPLSGSTLSYYTENGDGNGKYVIAAIGSLGTPTCDRDIIPEIYMRVGVHMKWILDSMEP